MKKAKLYRMVKSDHICPFGIKSKDLLIKEGFEVIDHHLENEEQTKKFKSEHGVKTTPQTFIDNERIGGYEDLLTYFNKKSLKQVGTTYQPIIAVFAVTFLMSLSFNWSMSSDIKIINLIESFVAISMCVLAILKLRDLYSFSNQFISYDLLAKNFINYSYIYPFAEGLSGLGMIAGVFTPLVAVVSIFIGFIGGVSVIKAVYIEKRDIKCACVGGDSNVPLGFISLTENIMMFAMGIWMLFKYSRNFPL